MTGAYPIVAISQRVDVLKDRNERRDALDQRWYPFFFRLWPYADADAEHGELCKAVARTS